MQIMLERIIDFGNAMQCFSKITFDSFCSDVILVSDFYHFLKNVITLFFKFTNFHSKHIHTALTST